MNPGNSRSLILILRPASYPYLSSESTLATVIAGLKVTKNAFDHFPAAKEVLGSILVILDLVYVWFSSLNIQR